MSQQDTLIMILGLVMWTVNTNEPGILICRFQFNQSFLKIDKNGSTISKPMSKLSPWQESPGKLSFPCDLIRNCEKMGKDFSSYDLH